MVRVVRTSEGVQIDPSGKLAGRGAYLHEQRSCWELALSGPLAKALRCEITPQDRDRLLVFEASLPEETPLGSTEPNVEA